MSKNLFNSIFSKLENEDILSAELRHQISKKICTERKKLNMDQKDFAKKMGVSQSMVSKWESYSYNFSLDSIAKIFTKLSLSVKFQFDEYEKSEFYCDQPIESLQDSLNLLGA